MPRQDLIEWERFANRSSCGEVFALPWWARAVASAYGLQAYVFVATGTHGSEHGLGRVAERDGQRSQVLTGGGCDSVVGVLPVIRVCNWPFGDCLVSMPFCDSGASLAADKPTAKALLTRACEFADELGVPTVEIRQQKPLDGVSIGETAFGPVEIVGGARFGRRRWRLHEQTAQSKVRMLLTLPDSPEPLLRSFKSKLRNQIQKPIKEGLAIRMGGPELVDDFYRVFVENMRDLGSPVHSKRFVDEVVAQHGETARVFVVYANDRVLAGSVTLGFREVLSNPWASSLRRYGHLAPNMLLYWSMLEYACQNGYRTFDFGRSTVGSGTYRFKEQWGARPEPLYWYRFTRGDVKTRALQRDHGGMSAAVEIWKRLPVSVTKILGPRIRRHISL